MGGFEGSLGVQGAFAPGRLAFLVLLSEHEGSAFAGLLHRCGDRGSALGGEGVVEEAEAPARAFSRPSMVLQAEPDCLRTGHRLRLRCLRVAALSQRRAVRIVGRPGLTRQGSSRVALPEPRLGFQHMGSPQPGPPQLILGQVGRKARWSRPPARRMSSTDPPGRRWQ
ncbi:hypothetical protein SSP35_02_05220 [Streptomyces sp. NBRC 110611]|nr:hypothetical protein SSP35_02_05220 [Streptomyces sp. NBRC 110611]